MKRVLISIFVMLLLSTAALFADDPTLSETIQNLSGDAAKSYVNPIVSAFGANMNGGWFHSAPKAKLLGFDLELGVVAMAAPFDKEDQKFSTEGRFRFSREQAEALTADQATQLPASSYDALVDAIIQQDFVVGIAGPTIVGSDKDSVAVTFPAQNITYTYNGSQYTTAVGENQIKLPVTGLMDKLAALPLSALQIMIGSVAGTRLTYRFIPETELKKELGKLSYNGISIQHNPAFWLPLPLPVDLALNFNTQTLKQGSLMKATASSGGVNVSKTFGTKLLNVTPYGGLSIETSSIEFKYDYIIDTPVGPSTQRVKFKSDGKNSGRMTMGLNFRLGIANLNIDYNIAKYASATAGLMINCSF